MIITHVKHLTEALARFDPDAKLEFEMDVQGIAPASRCSVTYAGISENPIDLKESNADLDERNDELIKALEAIKDEIAKDKPNMEAIKEAVKDAEI